MIIMHLRQNDANYSITMPFEHEMSYFRILDLDLTVLSPL